MTSNRSRPSSSTVSIGLPVYNGDKYLREAIESALAQTYSNFELIISDNKSNDNTQDICLAYAALDPRVRYFRQSENLGAHMNFVFVAMKAEGDLFTWLAHDDILEPEFLAEAVEYMSTRPEVTLVTGDFKIIGGDGLESGFEKLESIRGHLPWASRRLKFFRYPISNVYFCIYGVVRSLACKAALQSVSPPKVLSGSEAPILVRLAVTGEIESIPRIWRKYRLHAISISRSEVSETMQKPALKRFFVRREDLWIRRRDQWVTLVSSDLSFWEKLSISTSMLTWYIAYFIFEILSRSKYYRVIRNSISRLQTHTWSTGKNAEKR